MLYNLREYHRPTDLDEAVRLLQRKDIRTVAIGGGVSVVGEGTPEIEAVVDLENLGLDFLEQEGSIVQIGAMVRLQMVVETMGRLASGALAETARRMAGWHIRNASTIGGALASGNLHAPLCVMLAALDATVTIYDGQAEQSIAWTTLAEEIQHSGLHGVLIIKVALDVSPRIGAAYEQVGRTPADLPIVSAAAVIRPLSGGQIGATVAIGGLLHGIAMVKGQVSQSNIDTVVAQMDTLGNDIALFQADYRGSAKYRRSAAETLVRRVLHQAAKDADLAV